MAAKGEARARGLALRGSETIEAAAAFAARLSVAGLALARERRIRVASAYWPIGAEVSTLPLLSALDEAGVTVALPVAGAIGGALLFRQWRTGDMMIRGRMNIPEPSPEQPALLPDLLFVPLAAFDRQGQRLGYGAGFYDRSLAELRQRQRVLAVGIGYACQEVAAIPHEPHDQALDMVLTERELIVCTAAGS